MFSFYRHLRRTLSGHNRIVRWINLVLGSFDLPEPDRNNKDLNLQTSMDFLDYRELEEYTRTQDSRLNFITHAAIIFLLGYTSMMPFVDPIKNSWYSLLVLPCWLFLCHKKGV